MALTPLPIDSILSQVQSSLEANPCLVIQASPGSGKTTRVPPALLRAGFRNEKDEIVVLEPRRLAAKYAAFRVAEEMGEAIGKTVGYQFRLENVGSPATRLRFLTEGMLMRKLIGDPGLRGVSAVILDEFHERHLHGDLALAYLRHLQRTERPDLRIVVMSATLDVPGITSYLGDCPVLEVNARPYPVTVEHLPSPPAKNLDSLVKDAVSSALKAPLKERGDILVFLPGMADIRRCADAVQGLGREDAVVIPLHGELTREEQDRAMKRSERTKVILSTNVAETSLTIDGVTTVIDSGLHRMASYSYWSGVPSLRTRPTSRASAIQRAGRAGRTAPGRCIRLYTQGDFEARTPFDRPEIQRADICQSLLELKALGIGDLSKFPWFEAPSSQSIQAATELLFLLGALDSGGSLTELGRRMVHLPAHPRISRFLIEAVRWGCLDEAATLASLITEGRLEKMDALEQLAQSPPERMDEIFRRTRRQLLDAFRSTEPPTKKDSSKLAFALLTGFPDRVARKRRIPSHSNRGRANETELVFSRGGSARVEEAGIIAHDETFVVLDVQEQQHLGQARAQPKIRSVVSIPEEWLFDLEPTLLADREETIWDADRKRITARSVLAYGDLILSESASAPKDLAHASRLLLKAVLNLDPDRIGSMSIQDWITATSPLTDAEQFEASMARIALLAKTDPASGVTPLSGESVGQAVLKLLEGKWSLEELRSTDWNAEILAALAPEQMHDLERRLPTSIQLPGGRRARVQYKLGQAPWVESRLQDFFGMKQGPALLEGRVPLTLHLLAPNQRAVQVTTDLAGFWQRGYQELRGALSRRYPRHSWPEDPLKAEPPQPKSEIRRSR